MTHHSHQTSPLTLKVAKIWTSAEGTNQTLPLDVKLEFPGEINAVSNLTGELMLIKLKEEISAILSDAEIDVKLNCTKCLNEFTLTINIPGAERQYLSKKPSTPEDISDVFLIDMKDLTIDLSEMVRQEIILHFPFIPVCSDSCKGLCPVCGKNRNLKPCKCSQEEWETNKPFKDLKKIIKSTTTRAKSKTRAKQA